MKRWCFTVILSSLFLTGCAEGKADTHASESANDGTQMTMASSSTKEENYANIETKVNGLFGEDGVITYEATMDKTIKECREEFNKVECDRLDLYKKIELAEKQYQFFSDVSTNMRKVDLSTLELSMEYEKKPESYDSYFALATELDQASEKSEGYFVGYLEESLTLFQQYHGLMSYLGEFGYYLNTWNAVRMISEEKIVATEEELNNLPEDSQKELLLEQLLSLKAEYQTLKAAADEYASKTEEDIKAEVKEYIHANDMITPEQLVNNEIEISAFKYDSDMGTRWHVECYSYKYMKSHRTLIIVPPGQILTEQEFGERFSQEE